MDTLECLMKVVLSCSCLSELVRIYVCGWVMYRKWIYRIHSVMCTYCLIAEREARQPIPVALTLYYFAELAAGPITTPLCICMHVLVCVQRTREKCRKAD